MSTLVSRLRAIAKLHPEAAEPFNEAADEIERLRVEADEADTIAERQTALLHGIANAVHGGPHPSGFWSWHDLAEQVERLRTALALACNELFGTCDPLETSPQELVAHFMNEATP